MDAYLAAAIFWTIVGAVLGALVGPRNGWSPGAGAAIGALLGPIGVLILLLVRGGRPTAQELEDRRRWEDWARWQQVQAAGPPSPPTWSQAAPWLATPNTWMPGYPPSAAPRPDLFVVPNFREDIRVLPSLFMTRRLLWLPLAIFLSGLVLVLIIGALPTDIGGIADLYLQFFFVPPALFTFFIAGFVAPRASYLVGFIYGVIGGLTWFFGLVPPGAVPDAASFASAYVTTLMYGVVYGTLAALLGRFFVRLFVWLRSS